MFNNVWHFWYYDFILKIFTKPNIVSLNIKPRMVKIEKENAVNI